MAKDPNTAQYGSPYAHQAFLAVSKALFKFRHRYGEWDDAGRQRAMGEAKQTLFRFIAAHQDQILCASEIEEIPKRCVEWVEKNMTPRARRHTVGEGKSLREASIADFAEKYHRDIGAWPSVRDTVLTTGQSHGSAQRGLKFARARRASMDAVGRLDVDGRILRGVLKRMFRPEYLVAMSASALCEHLWGNDAGQRIDELDPLLALAAANLGLNAVRHESTVALYPRGARLSEENAKQLIPAFRIPAETTLSANLRNGPLFGSEEAMDLWAMEGVGIGEGVFEHFERIVELHDLVRPDRALNHIRRSIETAAQYDSDTDLAWFVAKGLRNAVNCGEVSDAERHVWPKIAAFILDTFNFAQEGGGDWIARNSVISRAWVSRGAAAVRRGEFLLHLLSYDGGIWTIRDHMRLEKEGNWTFDPNLSDRTNCAPAAYYGSGLYGLSTYEACKDAEAQAEVEALARPRERRRRTPEEIAKGNEIRTRAKELIDAKLAAKRAGLSLPPSPKVAACVAAPPTFAELDQETARLDAFAAKLAAGPFQGEA